MCSNTRQTPAWHGLLLTDSSVPPPAPGAPRAPPLRRQYSKLLAAAFEKRPDLRVVICHALRRICTQTRAALAAAGELTGHADPCAVLSGGSGGGDDEGWLAVSQEEAAHVDIPDGFTVETARE